MHSRIEEVNSILSLATFLATGVCLAAQEPAPQPINPPPLSEATEQAVAQLIRSTDLREKAWGVYLAGEYGFKNLEEDIAGLRVPLTPGTLWEIVSFKQVILDSLIRLNAKITSEEVMPYRNRFPEEVTILLLLRPEDHEKELLALAEESQKGLGWVAVCNALAETKAPGFAALLLRTLKVKAVVSVSDQEEIAGAGGGGWGSAGDGIGQIPRGFPPMASYSLTDQPSRGAIVIAPGTTPIYYVRKLVSTYRQFPTCQTDHGGNEDEKRLEYLAQLLETPISEFLLKANPTFQVTWTTEEEAVEQLKLISDALHTYYADTVRHLISKGLLTQAEAQKLKPQINIEIKDLRTDKSIPLRSLEE